MFFDTFEQVKKMNKAGFSQKQSEAVVNTMGDLVKEKFVTKQDMSEALLKERIIIKDEFSKLREDMSNGFSKNEKEFEKVDLKLKIQRISLVLVLGSLFLAGPSIHEGIKKLIELYF